VVLVRLLNPFPKLRGHPMNQPAYFVSIKGVVVRDGLVLLLKNERDEWELLGGRIEAGETPEQCCSRDRQGDAVEGEHRADPRLAVTTSTWQGRTCSS
jgi:hypothetical protein